MTHLSKRCYRTKRLLVLFMQVFSDVLQYLQVLSIYVAWLGYLVKPWFHYWSNKCLNLSFPFNTVIDTDFSPVCCAICLINLHASTWLSRVKVGLLWNTTNTKQMLTNILAFILLLSLCIIRCHSKHFWSCNIYSEEIAISGKLIFFFWFNSSCAIIGQWSTYSCSQRLSFVAVLDWLLLKLSGQQL